MAENDRTTGLVGYSGAKVPVAVVATTNITLTAEQTIDGVTTSSSRVLLTGQTDATENGIWVTDTGEWERARDADGAYDFVRGSLVPVADGGTVNGGTVWRLTTEDPVPGTTDLDFELGLFTSSAGSSFIQAGTGAVTRSSQNKMRDIVSVMDFGAVGDDVDDTAAFQAAADSLTRGGTVFAPPGDYRLTSTVTVNGKPIIFDGSGMSSATGKGSTLTIDTGSGTGVNFINADGSGVRNFYVTGDSITGGYFIEFNTDAGAGTFQALLENLRMANGWGAVRARDAFYIRFQNVSTTDFNGTQVILCNGTDDASRVDAMEFIQCSISPGSANPTTDCVVCDGLGGSIKFMGTGLLYGRHGLWLKNTTAGDVPSFFYFVASGCENGNGDAIKLDAGNHGLISGSYIATDGAGYGIRQGSAFGDDLTITGNLIRGNGRTGIYLEKGYATVTGNQILNNGRVGAAANAVNISGAANNGSGLIRITHAAFTNALVTGDRVRVTGVTGTVEANGDWQVTVISSTTFDLVGSTFANAYTSAGTAYLLSYGVRLGASCTRAVVTGNQIGVAGSGTNRQDYGLLDEGTGNTTEPNETTGNVTGGTLRLAINGTTGLERFEQVNRIINGDYRFAQRGATALSVADDTYGPDRWYGLSQTAAIQYDQLATPYSGARYAARWTQPQAAAQRFGCAQIIEGKDCMDLRGRTVNWSGRFRHSIANQTMRFFILEWTGTEDAVTSDVVLSWLSTTFTINNFFANTTYTISGPQAYTTTAAQWTNFKIEATLGVAFTNLILFAAIFGAQAQNVTLDIANTALVPGTIPPFPFHQRPFAQEKALCDRFYWTGDVYVPATTAQNLRGLNMRGVPTIAGGGAGFTSTGTTKDSLIAFQTGGAVATLTLAAEL